MGRSSAGWQDTAEHAAAPTLAAPGTTSRATFRTGLTWRPPSVRLPPCSQAVVDPSVPPHYLERPLPGRLLGDGDASNTHWLYNKKK